MNVSHLVTPPAEPGRCGSSHPVTRHRCVFGPHPHGLHFTGCASGLPGWMWDTPTGRTHSPVGTVYVTYFGRFVPQPGYVADEVVEHFPDQAILHQEITRRITDRQGMSFAPEDGGRVLRYSQVAPGAYMDVWVLVSADHRIHDPVPEPCVTRPVERWYLLTDGTLCRSEYLAVVAR